MALNKFMHQRNIYRTPPDFEKLSKQDPEFSKIAKLDVTGKVTIDFKDPHALRVLTKCLLKTDFNLDVEIPEDRLVPTLPLRLNYILWIEDLMTAVQRTSEIRGIDIGTGACAVYPLLAAVKNKWYMLATETDLISLQKAKENIECNNLQKLIELTNNSGSKLIENLFTEQKKGKFDFCMCNPPFYSNLQELYESRSPARLPPKNGFTGSPQELITEGGELEFCRKLIEESKNCKDNILIFTTMVGHKCSLSELLLDLKADGIKHTHTEFCQGRVTRWGLAWTYQDHDIYHLVPPRDKPRKKIAPVAHQLPPLPDCQYNMQAAFNKIKTILSGLQIQQKILNKCGNRISLDIIAIENTWSNQRRKRRLMKRTEAIDPKRLKSDADETDNSKTSGASSENMDVLKTNQNESTNENSEMKTTVDTNMLNSDVEIKLHIETSQNNQKTDDSTDLHLCKNVPVNDKTGSTDVNDTLKVQNASENIASTSKSENVANAKPLIHAFMKLFKKDDLIQFEIEFIDGTGGKESVYQVVQYIKNNWK